MAMCMKERRKSAVKKSHKQFQMHRSNIRLLEAPKVYPSLEAPKSHSSLEAPKLYFSLEAQKPHSSLEAPKLYFSLEAQKPHYSLEAQKSHSSLEAPKPHSSLEAPKLYFSLETPKPHSSLEAPKPHSSLEAPKPHSSLEAPKPHSSLETSLSVDVMQVLTNILLELPQLLHATMQERQGRIQEKVDNDKLQGQGEIMQLIRHKLVCVDVALPPVPPRKPDFGNSVILVVGSDEKRIDLVIVDVLNRTRMTFKVVTPINITGRGDEWVKSGELQTLYWKITNQKDVCVVLVCALNEFKGVCDFMQIFFVLIGDDFEEEEEEKAPTGVPSGSKNTTEKPSCSEARKPVPSPITVYTNFCKMPNPEIEEGRPKPITLQPFHSQQPNGNVESNPDKKEASLCGECCCCIFSICFG